MTLRDAIDILRDALGEASGPTIAEKREVFEILDAMVAVIEGRVYKPEE